MRIRRVTVRQRHGYRFPEPISAELGPGITVISGPNASGKTTLADGLGIALWDESKKDHDIELTFEDELRTVVVRTGDQRPRDQQPVAIVGKREAYQLSLRTVIGIKPDTVEKVIRDQLDGGDPLVWEQKIKPVELDRAQAEVRTATDNLKRAVEEAQRVAKAADGLTDREAALENLRAQIKQAEYANWYLADFRDSVALAEAVAELKTFDPRLEGLTSATLSEVEGMASRRTEVERSVDERRLEL
ncbi:MAG: AAA family ATPase, partial [Fimbriimonadaceae bacterium]|nr:AAA family ATPase [Fimbriimonadaceae bacterium]